MFKSILVPLDGSHLAEAGLPAAASLAEKLNAPVTLLHVIEENAPEAVHNERHLTQPQEAEAYLQGLGGAIFSSGGQSQLACPQRAGQGCTGQHCRTHRRIPSRSDHHVRARTKRHPRYAIWQDRPSGCRKGFNTFASAPANDFRTETVQTRRILLPLDDESIHDDSFPIAKILAKAYDAELALLCVIPTFSTLRGDEAATSTILPTTTNALLDIKEEHAKEHLQGHLNELAGEGFRVSAEIARGDPTQTIVNAAEHSKADLIVLSTHRRAGIDAFWARSVAPNVARQTRIAFIAHSTAATITVKI